MKRACCMWHPYDEAVFLATPNRGLDRGVLVTHWQSPMTLCSLNRPFIRLLTPSKKNDKKQN